MSPHVGPHAVKGPALDRRTLVLGAAAGICVSATTAGRGASAAPRLAESPAGAYAAVAWRPLAGDVLPSNGGPVVLVAIQEERPSDFESFRLRFRTVDGRDLPEQLVVRHPQLGRVMFMVTAAGATGVAVVNRRRS